MPLLSKIPVLSKVFVYRPGDENRIALPPMGRAETILRIARLMERYHRYEVIGLEHVPRTGSALMVSPHAYMPLDMFLLGRRVFERDGRMMRGLSEHIAFIIPGLRDLFTAFGIVDGTQENGLALLKSGQLAVCMPGGSRDWCRPASQRRTLRWANHRGYARLAVRAGVPIIPTACPAADDLYVVLNDGLKFSDALQRIFRIKYRLPATLAIGLGLAPLPVKLTQHVAPPLWAKAEGTEDERVLDLDTRVRAVLEELLSRE